MKKKANRILSLVLVLSMLLGCVPQAAYAAEPEEVMETVSENAAEEVSGNEVSENEAVSGNESISENEAVSGNESVSENEAVSGNESISENETLSENEAVSENEAAEEESVSGNESVSENVSADENGQEIPAFPETGEEPRPEQAATVVEVASWEELQAAFDATEAKTTRTIKLMKDLYMDSDSLTRDAEAFQVYIVYGDVTLDFNGHSLKGYLNAPTDNTLCTWAFLRFYLAVGNVGYFETWADTAATLTFEDSAGGGGVSYTADTLVDYPCQAVDVKAYGKFVKYTAADNSTSNTLYYGWQCPDHKVIVNGGNFYLKNNMTKFTKCGMYRLYESENEHDPWAVPVFVRAAFSVKNVSNTEINGGKFTSEGQLMFDGENVCAREMGAFAIGGEVAPGLRINGGVFQSDGYAVKGTRFFWSYYHSLEDVTDRDQMPQIRGGVFRGGICLTGREVRYMDDFKDDYAEDFYPIDFNINRDISADMLFAQDSELYISLESKEAADLTWEDLELESLIEVYPQDLAAIKEISINNESQAGKTCYSCLEGNKLTIRGASESFGDWVRSMAPTDTYVNNEYSIYKASDPTTPVWTRTGYGLNFSADYTAEEGEYLLRMRRWITFGTRTVVEAETEMALYVDSTYINAIGFAAVWNCDEDNDMTLSVSGESEVVDYEQPVLAMNQKTIDAVRTGDVISVSMVIKPKNGMSWGADPVIILGSYRLDKYVAQDDGARKYFADNITVPVPDGGLHLNSVSLTFIEPEVGSALPEMKNGYVTGIKKKWMDNKGVKLLNFCWFKDGEEVTDWADEVMEEGHIYSYSAVLMPEEYYHFTEEPQISRSDESGENKIQLHPGIMGDGCIELSEYFIIPNADGSMPDVHYWTLAHDENEHYYYCPHCDSIKDRTAHTFSEWDTFVEADEDSVGMDTRFCTVCGYVEYRSKDALDSITVTTAPDRTYYKPGEVFRPSGMVVRADYVDGTTKTITDYTFSPDGPLTEEDTFVTISYTEEGVTKTTTLAITVCDLLSVNVEVAEPSNYSLPGEPVCTTKGVYLSTYEWYRLSGDAPLEMGEDERFVYGNDYRLHVIVKTEESGLYIDSYDQLLVNSKKGENYISGSDFANYYYDFRHEVLSEPAVRVVEPVAGQTYSLAVEKDGDGYRASIIGWYKGEDTSGEKLSGTDPFVAGEKYTVELVLTTVLTNEFDRENLKILVNGRESELLSRSELDSGLLYAQHCSLTFTAGNTASELSGISITSEPEKTIYFTGESFSTAGMVVTARYSDGSTMQVAGYETEPSGALTEEDKAVTISYTAGGITKTATQKISVSNASESLYVMFTGGDSFEYTGAKITPAVKVKYRGEELVPGVDYKVKYKNNVNASAGRSKQPTVVVKGITVPANGQRSFTITRKDITDEDVIAGGITVKSGKYAAPLLYYGAKKLTARDLAYAKQKYTENGYLTVEGKGNYCGKRSLTVSVDEPQKIKVTGFAPGERSYNAMSQVLDPSELVVMSGTKTLSYDSDYTISYQANTTDAGTIKVAIIGINGYSGAVIKSYKIMPLTGGANVNLTDSAEFRSGGVRPKVIVTCGTQTLLAGRDYTLKFSNNKTVSSKKNASVKVSFIGNYKGMAPITKEYSVTACDLEKNRAQIFAADKVYTKAGKYFTAPYVEVNGTVLTAKDMDVSYRIKDSEYSAKDKVTDAMMADGRLTVEVTVTGKGNYSGSLTTSYTISKAEKTQDLSGAKVRFDQKTYSYTGLRVSPTVTVTMGSGKTAVTLTEGVDYKLVCLGNINKGKGICLVVGLGSSGEGSVKYYGCKTAKFTIGKGTLGWR
ncbi:MAG: bacterial Ig-like domain-containing protein [Lachnospiraceae bacterium]|nr:bacterial Ig-like domain-containing protein [Lachnospiraceae bacterium]